MKTQTITLLTLCFLAFGIQAQNIEITFANAQNTSDGSNHFYEADIMIRAIDGLASFKLGSGQIYFNYNTAAFGTMINNNNKVTFDYTGAICDQGIDAAPAAKIYHNFIVNDNSASRVSWGFSQNFASGTFAANNVTASTKKLCHIKIQYIDVSQDPNVAFENDETVLNQARDQFYTACGPHTSANPFATKDCISAPQSQFQDAIFDSSGAALSTLDTHDITLAEIYVFPNPSKETFKVRNLKKVAKMRIFNLKGTLILENKSYQGEDIDISSLQSGLYVVSVKTDRSSKTFKLLKD